MVCAMVRGVLCFGGSVCGRCFRALALPGGLRLKGDERVWPPVHIREIALRLCCA